MNPSELPALRPLGPIFLKKKRRYGHKERVSKISDPCRFTSGYGVRYKFKHKQGSQGDKGKIHVTQQFSQLAALGVTFKKNNKPVFDWSGGRVQTDTPTRIYTSFTSAFVTWIFDSILIFSLKFINECFISLTCRFSIGRSETDFHCQQFGS